jgi:hypothetical protein
MPDGVRHATGLHSAPVVVGRTIDGLPVRLLHVVVSEADSEQRQLS